MSDLNMDRNTKELIKCLIGISAVLWITEITIVVIACFFLVGCHTLDYLEYDDYKAEEHVDPESNRMIKNGWHHEGFVSFERGQYIPVKDK